jgi:uncharacterized membrane protein SirB2
MQEEDNLKKQSVPAFVLLSFPLWGMIPVMAIGCFFPMTDSLNNFLTVIGGIALMYSASPIFIMENANFIGKLLLLLIYCAYACVALLFVGYMAKCWFCPSCAF